MRRGSRVSKLTLVALVALVLACAAAAGSAASAGQQVVIVDSLGGVPTTQTFDGRASGGYVVGATYPGRALAGPRFVLTSPMVITQAGAFLNSLANVPGAPPFVVRFVSADVNGAPGDPDGPLGRGSFELSDDGDPGIVSFESAHPGLSLQPGTYYALFDAQPGGVFGYLMQVALSPFFYLPGPLDLGFRSPFMGAVLEPGQNAGVRVLAVPGTAIDHVAITFVADVGGTTVRWEGDLGAGAFLDEDGNVSVDSTFGDTHVTADLRSRHVARLMTGSVTATRGLASIQLRNVNAPFTTASDGAVSTVSPIRGSYSNGRSTTFGQITLRFELAG
jgi:hypothetical protein